MFEEKDSTEDGKGASTLKWKRREKVGLERREMEGKMKRICI